MATLDIYVISSIDGTNLVYVETREEAARICADPPGLFKWEKLIKFERVR